MPDPVIPVDTIDLAFKPQPWPFAVGRRAGIDAHFAALKARKPAVWNGRILLLHEHTLEHGVLRGAYLETDFASFVAWKDWRVMDAGVTDCTAASALVSADGALLLGVMGAHTFNAGRIYFPCGTPDPNDIVNGRVDLEASARRELEEETGLTAAKFTADPGWLLVRTDRQLMLAVKVLRARESADQLRARILANLAREQHPELADIRIVRGPSDVDPMMPDFATMFLDYWWQSYAAKASTP